MSEDQSGKQDRRVNPYIAGSQVSGPEMFYGREDVFEFIRRNLIGQHRDSPIVLYGQRRTGKTSVLYQIHRWIGPAYRCVFIDLHGVSLNGIADLLNGIATAVSRGLSHDYGIVIDAPTRSAFDADPRSVFESLFLDAVMATLGDDHLVLMLDEVVRLDEEVRAGRMEREVFDYLRHLMQHHPRLNFIFSLGSGLEELQKDYAFMFMVALYHRISFLEVAAARDLVTDPVREFFEVAPEAVNTILRVTSGHAYYTQLVCHSLFDLWSRSPKPVMTAEDVYAALGEAIELGSPNLTYVWEDSSPEEKAVMAAMAAAMRAGTHAVNGSAIRAIWRKVSVPLPERKLAAALRSLVSREVITGIEAYSFTVDLQRLWLDKHRRLDWVMDELADSIDQWTRDARTSRIRYVAALAVLILVAGYFVAGKLAGFPPFTGGTSTDTLSLENILYESIPGNLSQQSKHCQQATPSGQWNTSGLVVEIHCTTPTLPGGNVYGYLFKSKDDFKTSWEAFNTWWQFPASPGKTCPPPTGYGQQSHKDPSFPSVLFVRECGLLHAGGKIVPAYAWDNPTGNDYILVEGGSGSSYTTLTSLVNNTPVTPTLASTSPLMALALTNQSADAAGLLPPSTCKQDNSTQVTCTAPAPGISEAVFRTYPSLTALYAAYTAKVTSLSPSGQFTQNFSDCGLQQTVGEVGWNHQFQHPKTYTVSQMSAGKVTDDQAAGRVYCNFVQGLEYMVWTQDDGHLMGIVAGPVHENVWTWWVAVHHNITPAAALATPPTGLTATAGYGEVTLSWATPASDGGSPISGYNVYMATTADFKGNALVGRVSGTTVTITGLVKSTTYYFEVTAVNPVGAGPASAAVSATTASHAITG